MKPTSICKKRKQLGEYINQTIYGYAQSTLHFDHVYYRMLIQDVHINEKIYYDHLWVELLTEIEQLKRAETIYFYATVSLYRKNNFRVISYTLGDIHLITHTEYKQHLNN